jgi:hypothetical protein
MMSDQPAKPVNPLDDLQRFSQSSLPRQHTSGRRELRREDYARGLTIHAKPKSVDEKTRALVTGEMIATDPIRRAEPKRGGLSKKAWKKLRKAAQAVEDQSNDPAT